MSAGTPSSAATDRPNPSLAVIIATLGRPEVIRPCLTALRAQTRRPEEIVIVAGDDAEAVDAVAAEFAHDLALCVIRQHAPGVVRARNDGWRASRTDLVVFLDDDAIADPAWCQAISTAFARSPDVAGVTGPTVIPPEHRGGRDLFRFVAALEKPTWWRSLARWYYTRLVMRGLSLEVARMGPGGLQSIGSNYANARELPGPRPADYLEACNMAVRRDFLERAGGFDDGYLGTGEWNEPDLAFRLRALGGQLVFDPRAAVEHHPSQSGVFASRRAAAERMHNYLRFYFRWMWRPSRLVALGATVLMFNTFWIVRFMQSRDVRWLSGLTATVTGMYRYGLLRRERTPAGPESPGGDMP